LAVEPLQRVDLILCRDCLVHLPFRDGLALLGNFRQSGSRYLLTTTFSQLAKNNEVKMTGNWRPLNLELPPFCLPPPLYLLAEGCTEMDGRYGDKSLGLWRLADLDL
jgi:hypothetical protein